MIFKFFLFFLSFVLSFTAPCFGQEGEATIQALYKSLRTAEDDSTKISIYLDLSWEYFFMNYDSALHYSGWALELSDEKSQPYLTANALEMKALLLETAGDVGGAIRLYLQSIPMRQAMGGAGLESTYNNMAAAFQTQGNLRKALEYYYKSYEIEREHGPSKGMAESLINIAIIERNLYALDSAIAHLNKAASIARQFDESGTLVDAYLNIASWHAAKNGVDSAKFYYQLSYDLASEMRTKVVASVGLGICYRKKKNHAMALAYLDTAETMAQQINTLDYLKRVYLERAEILGEMGDYKNALSNFKFYQTIQDSLVNMEVITLTNDLERKYKIESAERELAEMKLAAAESSLTAEAAAQQRRLLLFIAIILALGIAFLAYRYKAKQKTGRILVQKNNTIEKALAEREVLLREIHHRVKNNLQVISSLLSLQSREISDKEALNAVNESKQRVQSMALIHQSLYADSNLKAVNMKQYVGQLSEALFHAYKLNHDEIELLIEVDSLFLDIDTAIPLGLILNELITNSLKYAFPNGGQGSISIRLWEESNTLHLAVADSGVGKARETREGFSFGMRMIEAFCKKLKAELAIRDSNGYATELRISKYIKQWNEKSEYSL